MKMFLSYTEIAPLESFYLFYILDVSFRKKKKLTVILL